MRAGSLDRVITVQRATVTIDGFGVAKETWTDHVALRASVKEMAATERPEQHGAQSETAITFKTWFVPGLTLADRVTFEGRAFNIVGLKELGRRQALEIKAVMIGTVIAPEPESPAFPDNSTGASEYFHFFA